MRKGKTFSLKAGVEVAMSHTDIGKALGVHRTRVEQIERKALAKAAEIFRAKGIKLQDLLD